MFGSKNTATNQSVDFEWSQFTALCNSKEMEVGKNRSIEYYRTSSCVSLSAVAKQMWSRLVSRWVTVVSAGRRQCSSPRIQWCSPSHASPASMCNVSTDYRANSGSSKKSRSSPPLVCIHHPSERLQGRPTAWWQLAPRQNCQDVLVVSEVISESLRASSVTTVDAWTTGQRSSRLRHVCSVPGPTWTWFLLTPALTWTTPGWSEGHVPPLGGDNNCM